MGLGSSIFIGAAGAVLRFQAAAQAVGFKVHAIGVIFMIGGIIGVVTSVMNWNTWGGFHRAKPYGSGDTVLIDRVTFPCTFKVERPFAGVRRNDPLLRMRKQR